MNVMSALPFSRLLAPLIHHPRRIIAAWASLDDRMPAVNRAFNKAREELREVGLLDDYFYLDRIDLCVTTMPSFGESGYVFEELSALNSMAGYEEGVIYLPCDLPQEAFIPGGTLTDTIRHEFGHAWHWLEPEYFERAWFFRAFGGEYSDEDTSPFKVWKARQAENRRVQRDLRKCRTERTAERFIRDLLLDDFVSEYAATSYSEDFAETFMIYLRNRNSLSRYANRPGVHKKLLAVEKAVANARRELGHA